MVISASVNIFKNGESLYKAGTGVLGILHKSDVGEPRTFNVTTSQFSSGFINKGDKITAKIDIFASTSASFHPSATCTQSDVTFEVYGQTTIIDPTLFKTEIREVTE